MDTDKPSAAKPQSNRGRGTSPSLSVPLCLCGGTSFGNQLGITNLTTETQRAQRWQISVSIRVHPWFRRFHLDARPPRPRGALELATTEPVRNIFAFIFAPLTEKGVLLAVIHSRGTLISQVQPRCAGHAVDKNEHFNNELPIHASVRPLYIVKTEL